ncbi:MAG: PIN domain-containing protein [Acidobacteriota bacterium]
MDACQAWLRGLLERSARVIVPEIADYELRRELIRARKAKGLARLDALASHLEYSPLTTEAMRRASELWAEARQQGRPTADPKSLDGDVILAAQVLTFEDSRGGGVVATTNVGHLTRMVPARHWKDWKS